VHSKEQIRAWSESGGRSRLQHSQLGLNSSIVIQSDVPHAHPAREGWHWRAAFAM